MQQKIRGIVLRTVKVGDTSMVADLFTEQHGRMSFVVHISVSARRGSSGAAFWRPLNMVEFDTDLHGQGRLPHARSVRIFHNYATLPYQPVKQMIAMFLAEFLARVLQGQQADTPLYDYLVHSLQWLDTASGDVANFHLVLERAATSTCGRVPTRPHSRSTPTFSCPTTHSGCLCSSA